MAKKRIGALLIALGLLCSVAAIGLVGYNLWDDTRAGIAAERVLEVMEQHRDSVFEPEFPLEPEKEQELPVLEIDGNRYIGSVAVPAIGVELPVLENWSLPLLRIAPCRYLGSPYQNDLILCAHNYNSHFGKLKNLMPGDEVIFTDVAGNVFSYKVAVLEDLAGTDVAKMESGDWDLTLFTCTLDGRARVTVRCRAA